MSGRGLARRRPDSYSLLAIVGVILIFERVLVRHPTGARLGLFVRFSKHAAFVQALEERPNDVHEQWTASFRQKTAPA